jgi:hypothetical protein
MIAILRRQARNRFCESTQRLTNRVAYYEEGWYCPMNRQHIAAQILVRSWPFPRGAGRIIDRYFSRLPFKDEICVIRTTDGFDLKIMPNELIGRHIYLTGEFDRSTIEVLCNFAKPDDVLLDVGANIG